MKFSFGARARRGAAVMVWVLALLAAPLMARDQRLPGAAASAFKFVSAPAPRPLQTPVMRGFPYDWSHHHLIFSRPSAPEQAQRLQHEPRYLIQQAWRARNSRSGSVVEYMQALDAAAIQLASGHPARRLLVPNAARPLPKKRLGGDWSVNLGLNAKVGAGRYPAKFSFNPIGAPDCTNDFVVFNTGLTSSASQASVIAYNNLYKTACGSTVPSVYWSYKTGGKILNSAVLSGDGSQVALMHDGGTGAASLVLLKWKGGEGTSTPATPSTVTTTPAGGMAAAIGGRTAKAGYTVEVVSRDPAKARALADQLAAGATTGTYGAAPAGDIVILAVPYTSAAAVVAEYGDALDGKVIIDITNPISPDLTGLVTPDGSSGAQEIAKGAPAGAHVVKAFNTLFGHVLARGGRLDAFIAADDPEAKARVSTFIASLGLRPFDVGGLQMAQTLEALGLLLIGLARNGAGTFDIAFNVDLG